MDALRAHPFFNPVSWGTLWIDPTPPLEAGLVAKEPAEDVNIEPEELRKQQKQNVEDYAAEWRDAFPSWNNRTVEDRNPNISGSAVIESDGDVSSFSAPSILSHV